MNKHEDYAMAGWPSRSAFMDTSGGMHVLEYRVSEVDEELEDGGFRDRINPLSSKIEKVHTYIQYCEDGIIYYSSGLYQPLRDANMRVLNCLNGKLAKNFAQ